MNLLRAKLRAALLIPFACAGHDSAQAQIQWGDICGRRECTIPNPPPREESSAPSQQQNARDEFSEVTNAGVAAYNAGAFERALQLFREALTLKPRDRIAKYNVAILLYRIASRDYDRALNSRDAAALERIQRMLDEAAGLGGGSNTRELRQWVAKVRRDIPALKQQWATAELQRQIELAEQRRTDPNTPARRRVYQQQAMLRPTQTIGPETEARLAAYKAERRRQEQRLIQLNPGATTAEAGAIAQGSKPVGALPATATYEVLGSIAEGTQTPGQALDGGRTDRRLPIAPVRVPDTPSAVRILSSAEVAHFSRYAEFRQANAAFQLASAGLAGAERHRAALRARQQSSSGPEREQIRQAIARADEEIRRAKAAQRIAQIRREEVIKKIEAGAAEIVE